MQNEESLITGYQPLNAAQIGDMNMVKHLGKQCRDLVGYLEQQIRITTRARWIEVARNQLQLGLMALTQPVAKNDFF